MAKGITMAKTRNGADPVLDLQTLIERPHVRIDGILYEIRSPEEISLLDAARIAALGNRLSELFSIAELSTAEEREIGEVVDQLYSKVNASIPDEVTERLPDDFKISIIEVFTTLLPQAMKGQETMANQLIGAK